MGQDVGGMSYREAYEKGLVGPIAAHQYYDNLYSWGTGIDVKLLVSNVLM